jgi:hypothetical protein
MLHNNALDIASHTNKQSYTPFISRARKTTSSLLVEEEEEEECVSARGREMRGRLDVVVVF